MIPKGRGSMRFTIRSLNASLLWPSVGFDYVIEMKSKLLQICVLRASTQGGCFLHHDADNPDGCTRDGADKDFVVSSQLSFFFPRKRCSQAHIRLKENPGALVGFGRKECWNRSGCDHRRNRTRRPSRSRPIGHGRKEGRFLRVLLSKEE